MAFCAQGLNIDAVIHHLVTNVEVPKRDFEAPPTMSILRSFDVNKPGVGPRQLQGGVLTPRTTVKPWAVNRGVIY